MGIVAYQPRKSKYPLRRYVDPFLPPNSHSHEVPRDPLGKKVPHENGIWGGRKGSQYLLNKGGGSPFSGECLETFPGQAHGQTARRAAELPDALRRLAAGCTTRITWGPGAVGAKGNTAVWVCVCVCLFWRVPLVLWFGKKTRREPPFLGGPTFKKRQSSLLKGLGANELGLGQSPLGI